MDELNKAGSVTNIAKGTRVTANIETESDIRIAGSVDGDIKTSKKLILTDSGRITGTVIAREAIFEGRFTGELRVLDQITVRETAQIDGFIFSKKISVSEDASVIGIVSVSPDIDVLNAKLTKNPAKHEIKQAVAQAAKVIENSGSDSSQPSQTIEQNVSKKTTKRHIGNVLISLPGSDIDQKKAEQIKDSCGGFMNKLGFELEIFDDPKFDPYYQKLSFVRKTDETADDISDQYQKGKKSLETALLNKGNTEDGSELQKAADQLITTLKELDEFCIAIGNIVLIQLSEDEMQTIAVEIMPEGLATDLKKNPEMVTNLKNVYSYLED